MASYDLKEVASFAAREGIDLSPLRKSQQGMYRDRKKVWHHSLKCEDLSIAWWRLRSRMERYGSSNVFEASFCLRCAPVERIWFHENYRKFEAASDLAKFSRQLEKDLPSKPFEAFKEEHSIEATLASPAKWQSHEALTDAGALVWSRLLSRQERLSAFLESEEGRRATFEQVVAGKEVSTSYDLAGHRALLVLPAFKKEHLRPDLLHLILRVWGDVSATSPQHLVLPFGAGLVAKMYAQAYQTQQLLKPGRQGLVDLHPEDDDTIIETALGLWDPANDGPLSELRHALRAARAAVDSGE